RAFHVTGVQTCALPICAVGIACQKVSEAEIFAQAGFDDIMIPYNVLGATKAARFADLALYNRMTAAADNLPVIQGLSEAAAALRSEERRVGQECRARWA